MKNYGGMVLQMLLSGCGTEIYDFKTAEIPQFCHFDEGEITSGDSDYVISPKRSK
jgi:hypothetical protein